MLGNELTISGKRIRAWTECLYTVGVGSCTFVFVAIGHSRFSFDTEWRRKYLAHVVSKFLRLDRVRGDQLLHGTGRVQKPLFPSLFSRGPWDWDLLWVAKIGHRIIFFKKVAYVGDFLYDSYREKFEFGGTNRSHMCFCAKVYVKIPEKSRILSEICASR